MKNTNELNSTQHCIILNTQCTYINCSELTSRGSCLPRNPCIAKQTSASFVFLPYHSCGMAASKSHKPSPLQSVKSRWSIGLTEELWDLKIDHHFVDIQLKSIKKKVILQNLSKGNDQIDVKNPQFCVFGRFVKWIYWYPSKNLMCLETLDVWCQCQEGFFAVGYITVITY